MFVYLHWKQFYHTNVLEHIMLTCVHKTVLKVEIIIINGFFSLFLSPTLSNCVNSLFKFIIHFIRFRYIMSWKFVYSTSYFILIYNTMQTLLCCVDFVRAYSRGKDKCYLLARSLNCDYQTSFHYLINNKKNIFCKF